MAEDHGSAAPMLRPQWARRNPTARPIRVRYFQALDPRRSLATAVAWLAVAVSLVTALALIAVSTFAVNSMLVRRDAQMQRYAGELAEALERAVAQAIAAQPAAPDPRRVATGLVASG